MMTDPNIEIGRKLRHARKALSLSQQQVANVLGVSFQQVQKYEKGVNRLSADAIQTLHHDLGINLFSDLLVEKALSHQSDQERTWLDATEFELLRSYRKIKNPKLQKKVLHLIQAIHSDD